MMATIASRLPLEQTMIDSLSDERIRQQKRNEHQKKQEKEMTTSLLVNIREAENKVYECKETFDDFLHKTSLNSHNQNVMLNETLLELLQRRFRNMQKKFDTLRHSRIEHSLRRRQRIRRDPDCQTTYDHTSNNTIIHFSPTLIIDTIQHTFTSEQLKLLNRGPTYVPLYQMYITSSNESTLDLIKKTFKVLQHYLIVILKNANINIAQSTLIIKQIKDIYLLLFSRSLPSLLYQRALYEHNLIDSIRKQLQVNRLILRRTADQRNVFYLGNRDDFENKANTYMNTTDIFEVCEDVDDKNLKATRNYLRTKIKAFNDILNVIFHDKKYQDHLKKLTIDADKIELPYLYFLPDVSQVINKNMFSIHFISWNVMLLLIIVHRNVNILQSNPLLL